MIYEELLKRCPHISTADMGVDEWLDKRRKGIGGSEAGAVMGMSAYGSPLTVYLQKKNLVPKAETSKAAKRGTFLEPMIRVEAVKEFPELEIETVPFMFTDMEHAFMMANIDGVVFAKAPVEIRGEAIEGLGGFEAKSAKTNYGWGDDEIPDTYYAQVEHYMKVLGLSWFLVAVYILDDESIRYYVIRRNEQFISQLVVAEKVFWENYIEKNIIPAAIGIENEDDLITGMYDGSAATLALNEHEKTLCRKIAGLKEKIKALKDDEDAAKIDLKTSLTTRAKPSKTERKLSALGGEITVSWSFYETKSVDTKKLRDAGLYEQYSKTTEADRLTVTLKKGA